jgi:predicted transglutaminase-like cysteine proteinase
MNIKTAFFAAVALAAVAMPAAAQDVYGATADLNGQQVRIANTVTIMEDGDRWKVNELKRRLDRLYRQDGATYSDAEYGENFRRLVVRQMEFSRDSILLAVADNAQGERKTVVLLRVRDGSERTYVMDRSRNVILPITALLSQGWTFHARETEPGGVFVNFDGDKLS